MNKEVPNVDAEGGGNSIDVKLQEIEFRLLEADANARESKNREADQRYYLRWITVAVALLLIITMLVILTHMSHAIFLGPFLTVPSSYAVTLVVVPISSITAMILALFVAAFRGFKKGDEESAASAATESARNAGILG